MSLRIVLSFSPFLTHCRTFPSSANSKLWSTFSLEFDAIWADFKWNVQVGQVGIANGAEWGENFSLAAFCVIGVEVILPDDYHYSIFYS